MFRIYILPSDTHATLSKNIYETLVLKISQCLQKILLPLLWRHAASLDNHEYIFFQYVKYHTNNVITIVFIVVIRVKLKVLYLVLQQQRMHGYLHIHKNTRVVESATRGPTPE